MEKRKLAMELVVSEDGSHTIHVPELNENYHSQNGAIQESRHVFLSMGLHQSPNEGQLNILEVGFGTGLNALLTMVECGQRKVHYVALEPYPLGDSLIQKLNYATEIGGEAQRFYRQLHEAKWNESDELFPGFILEKRLTRLKEFTTNKVFDLVYFDAFAPLSEPELWTPDVWHKLIEMMCSGGRLVTYCAKGQVRRDMQAAGFDVERLPGPPGKREMLRCTKP